MQEERNVNMELTETFIKAIGSFCEKYHEGYLTEKSLSEVISSLYTTQYQVIKQIEITKEKKMALIKSMNDLFLQTIDSYINKHTS